MLQHDREQNLHGRTIVVCGAAGGIGAATVRGFVDRGATVAGVFHTSAPADDLKTIARWYQADLSQKAQVDQCFDRIAADLGGMDALIQPAGTWRPDAPEAVREDQIDFLMAVNFKSTVFTNQAAFRHMKDRGGRIVNFGSVEGVEGSPHSSIYAASRAAIQAWTRSVARAWGRYGVNVNVIAPFIYTPLFEAAEAQMDDAQRTALAAEMAARIPIDGKAGDPLRDCVPALAFLASEGSRFITGQLISVDGGFRMLGA